MKNYLISLTHTEKEHVMTMQMSRVICPHKPSPVRSRILGPNKSYLKIKKNKI